MNFNLEFMLLKFEKILMIQYKFQILPLLAMARLSWFLERPRKPSLSLVKDVHQCVRLDYSKLGIPQKLPID